jgi:hypothetical protein
VGGPSAVQSLVGGFSALPANIRHSATIFVVLSGWRAMAKEPMAHPNVWIMASRSVSDNGQSGKPPRPGGAVDQGRGAMSVSLPKRVVGEQHQPENYACLKELPVRFDLFVLLQPVPWGCLGLRLKHNRHRSSLHHWQQKQSWQLCFGDPVRAGT